MIWLSVFLVLSLIEVIYLWIQWDKISSIIDVGKMAHDLIGQQLKNNEHYKKVMGFKEKVAMIIFNFKGLTWVLICLILLGNVIISSVLTLVLKLFLMFL